MIIEIIVNIENEKEDIMITLYSTGCPTCERIIKILEDKNIEFKKITDEEEIYSCADKYQIENVPFAITSNGIVLHSPIEIIDFANGGNQ